jgi:hypothetical protein
MPIIHDIPVGFPTANPAGADFAKVQPLDYRANHNFPPYTLISVAEISDWAVPSARTEFQSSAVHGRWKQTFQYIDQVRLVACIKTPGGKGKLELQYSSDVTPATWNSLDGAGGPVVDLARYGVLDSGWKNIGPTLKAFTAAGADVWLRFAGKDGNASVHTIFGMTVVYAR